MKARKKAGIPFSSSSSFKKHFTKQKLIKTGSQTKICYERFALRRSTTLISLVLIQIFLKRMKTSIAKKKATTLLIIILSIIYLQIKAEGWHPAVKSDFHETIVRRAAAATQTVAIFPSKIRCLVRLPNETLNSK